MDDKCQGSVASLIQTAEDARVRWLLQAAPDATAIVDSSGRILAINGQLEQMFHYSCSELVGAQVECLVPERFRAQHPAHRRRYVENPSPRPMGLGHDLYGMRKDGSEFPAEISLCSMMTDEGILVSVAVRDVSQRRKVEDRFRRFVESSPDAVVIAKQDGTIVLVNARTEELFGYRREELLGEKVEILVPEQFRAIHPSKRAEYAAAPRVRAMGIGLELFGRRKDGSQFPIEISLSPMDSDDGPLVSSAIRDLTERRRAEGFRFQLAAIVDSSDDAIMSLGLDGEITSWNTAAEEIFGYPEAEAIGRPVAMLLPPGHEHEVDDMLTQLRAGERVRLHDARRLRRDGRTIDVSISMSAIRDRVGTLVGASQVVRDITERKRAEEALAAAKEAAETASQAFEAFSYSVAHDLRAPLRAIDGFSEALVAEYASAFDESGRDYLQRVRGSAQRMADLIDGLLSLARVTHRELDRVQVDLSQLAHSINERLQHEWTGRDVEVVVQPGLTCRGDAVLLANVLENLLANAWKFTEGRDKARIEFGRDREGYYVRDNGAGFDMAYSTKLFGVFQRLHSRQEFGGTGIGLATVQRIIQRHGGRIWADGGVGAGAVFHFTVRGA